MNQDEDDMIDDGDLEAMFTDEDEEMVEMKKKKTQKKKVNLFALLTLTDCVGFRRNQRKLLVAF